MKILHTADLHLRSDSDERWEALSAVVEVGKKEKADVLVIAGDLFDSARDANDLYPLLRKVFEGGGFPVLILPGNHDYDSYSKERFLGERVEVFSSLEKPVEIGDVRFWGLPFVPREHRNILHRLHSIREYLVGDKTNILVYHGELLDKIFERSDIGDEKAERYMPTRLSYFADLNLTYVLSGHYHTSFDILKFSDSGYFVYPGSPVSVTKRETGRRGVNLFTVGNAPSEYLLDTAHFLNKEIVCDPFSNDNPVDVIKGQLSGLHAHAAILVSVTGFIDGQRLNITEKQLKEKITPLLTGRGVLERYEVRDIGAILADDLFTAFERKLASMELPDDQKSCVRELAIKAMMEAAR